VDLLILIVLLALSGFFSGSETAYFSLRPSHLAELAQHGGPAGRRVVQLIQQSHGLLSALLIGNLLVNTAASVIATSLCVAWIGQRGLAVAVPAMTILLLLVGEMTPKMLALRFRRRQAILAQGPLSVWLILMTPVLKIITTVTDRLLRLLPLERTGQRGFTTAELEIACDLAVEEGRLSETEGRFLARLIRLQDLEVHQIMTPRPDVATLDVTWTREQMLAVAREAGFSRYPVVAAEKRQPIGFFHLKDLFDRPGQEWPLAGGLHDLLFVPESKDVAALLSELRSSGTHLAVVVDEHGDFSGIVTLADCLQALLGAVGDASPVSEVEAFQIDDGHWVIGGGMDLRGVDEVCAVKLPPSRDYVTIAGFIMARLGRIPEPGDRIEANGAVISVLEMEGHRTVRVKIERLDADAKEPRS
jgi:putative hemolysin